MAAGVDALGKPQAGDALFIVASWEDNGNGDAQTSAVVRSLSASGVRLFGISFDSSKLPGPLASQTFVSLQSFSPVDKAAKASGGMWMRTAVSDPALAWLPKASALVIADFYAVGLRLEHPITKNEEMKIQLVNPKSDPTHHETLSYPQTLYPCQ